MENGKRKDELSREEDYRDFEQRDLENGWPYDDDSAASRKPVGNAAYGEADGNFDRERDDGIRITRAGPDAGDTPAFPETGDERRTEDDDQLESDIAALIENLPGVNADLIDIRVESHVVTLRGSVDTADERRLVEMKVLGVKGIERVHNRLETIGSDSHIPRDTD
ncbi:MAG: transporter [Shinella sp.]|nr:MAG: transporter [Shinella sp.]